MYVLIDEWIPGCPTRLLGTTVEDLPDHGERIVKADVCKKWQGYTSMTSGNKQPEPRNKDPA